MIWEYSLLRWSVIRMRNTVQFRRYHRDGTHSTLHIFWGRYKD
jgi:hypothetical protein